MDCLGVPCLLVRGCSFAVPTVQLSQFRNEESSNRSLGWASPSQSYLQKQKERMGEQSQGDSRGRCTSSSKQTSYFTFPPACLHQNPFSLGHFTHMSSTHLLPLCVPAVKLLCLSLALNNRISCFQMRRICHQGKGDVPVSNAVNPPVVHSQVVLHVTRALVERR